MEGDTLKRKLKSWQILGLLALLSVLIIFLVMFSRQRQRSTISERAGVYSQNYEKYVHISKNEFSTDLLGGIKNLEITLNNEMPYAIQRAVVLVKYIKADKQIYKRDTLVFQYVSPSSKQVRKARDSDRGVSVEIELSEIKSDEIGLDKNIGG